MSEEEGDHCGGWNTDKTQHIGRAGHEKGNKAATFWVPDTLLHHK
jgi:hypothetical protein